MMNIFTGQMLSPGFGLFITIVLRGMVVLLSFKIFMIVHKSLSKRHSDSKECTSNTEAMLVVYPEITDAGCEMEFRNKAQKLDTSRQIELLAKAIVARERRNQEAEMKYS